MVASPIHSTASPSPAVKCQAASPKSVPGAGLNSEKTVRKMPYAPALMITPDSSALAGDGAAGWAFGSQVWTGNMPALTPKPSTSSTAAASRCGSLPDAPAPGSSEPPPIA